MHGENMLKTCL